MNPRVEITVEVKKASEIEEIIEKLQKISGENTNLDLLLRINYSS